MEGALKAVAAEMAKADRRFTADGHVRRAYEVVKDDGPLEEVEARIAGHLQSRVDSAVEREAFRIRLQAYQHNGLPSEEVLAPARQRVARDGGVTNEHARDLGYQGLEDLFASPA